jgi:hypothetical protein
MPRPRMIDWRYYDEIILHHREAGASWRQIGNMLLMPYSTIRSRYKRIHQPVYMIPKK